MSDELDDSENIVAVIGMAGRFPGARDVTQFWKNLREGVESVRWFTDEELIALGELPERLRDPQYVRACPVLEDIDKFDAGFFGFTPREAKITDPQHRIFLETAWAAMESAGLVPERYRGVVGVFATCGLNTYLMHHLVTNRELMDIVGEWLLRHTGNDMNFLATRASYEFDLRGPSMNVQTACSSSLVAIHQAAQSLLARECDAALAGGATISFPLLGYLYKEGEILAADGHCRPFDARSTGTLFGSGAGVVVLKRLADAMRDGDSVLAVLRGSAINNDGTRKMGYLAPSVDGQASVVAEALAISGVEPDSISYVEAHGTGTLVGDPIEVEALVQAYRASTSRTGYCALGSLKGNIGHLGEAAGVAGFMKTVLALQHRELPPSLHYETPNPSIDFAASPFFVNAKCRPWTSSGGPLRAGVTALGAGGTNAHVVVEEAPRSPNNDASRAAQLLLLSARTPAALDEATHNLASWLKANPTLSLADVAYTLQTGRRAFEHRRALVCRDAREAIALLDDRDPKRVMTQVLRAGTKREAVFMFAGGGAQYAGMGRELYDTEPVYRAVIDECLAFAKSELSGRDLRALMFPAPGAEESANAQLEAPSLALPALFATELAVARLLQSFGIEPAAMIGHSMGEYVAACIAGVFSVQDGIRLVATRGRLFETLPSGGMLVVPLSASEARRGVPDFDSTLSIAAANAPTLCVLSGPTAEIERAQSVFAKRDIDTTRVHIGVAAHSAMLEPILRPFEDMCRTIRFRAPERPYVSNLTGTWIRSEEATDPRYWVQHLRQTVRFADGLAKILETADRVLVEVGPGRTLASLARQQPVQAAATLATLAHPTEASAADVFLMAALGQLWMAGIEPDWARFYAKERRRKIALPTYPFERQRHWVDRNAVAEAPIDARAPSVLLRKVPDVRDWFWVPSWRRTAAPSASPEPRRRLLVMDNQGLGERLRARWPDAMTVTPETMADRAQVEALLAELARKGNLPDQIVHLGAVSTFDRDDSAIDTCFVGLLHLAQALALEERRVEILVVSAGAHATAPIERGSRSAIDPRKALVLGPVRVIAAEMPMLPCRQVDVGWPAPTLGAAAEVEAQVLAEAEATNVADRVVAYRGTARLAQSFDRVPLPAAHNTPWRAGGVYVITGGLGGVGLAIAGALARECRAKLVLIGRQGKPPGDAVKSLEALGAEVMVGAADVTDEAQMSALFEAARRRFGPIHGVIHAAGVLEDGLVQMKTTESCRRVLAPKVRGGLVIDRLLRGEHAPLDFVAFFSSVSAVLGLKGQIDYSSANAFLDALAMDRAAREPGLTVSIDWSAWRDVGMAAALAARNRHGGTTPRGVPAKHPWLGDVLTQTDERIVYGADVARNDMWMVAEHVVHGGEALIPGTGYLELARAAVAESEPSPRAIELSNVLFLAPFVVRDGDRLPLRIAVDRRNHSVRIGVASTEGDVLDHMTANARAIDAAPPAPLAIAAVAARCADRTELSDRKLPQAFMDFGPRWHNVRAMSFGAGEALLELELAESFTADLTRETLHPALLDMATGGAQRLIAGFDAARDFYVPFSYDRVVIHRALPRRLFSHVRHHAGGSMDMPSFDVTIADPDGNVCVELSGFTMKRLPTGAPLTASPAPPPIPPRAAENETTSAATQLREAAFREGMLPREGVEAFTRILASGMGPNVIATSLDLSDWMAALAADVAADTAAPKAAAAVSQQAQRTLRTPFEAPRNETEEKVASVWRTMLGVEQLGVHDDFFELGGHSLLLTQIVTRVRKQLQLDLPLRMLLTKLTVAEMAEVIASARAAPVAPAPAIKTLSRDAFRVKRSSLADGPGPGGPGKTDGKS